jgi:hypothetical protein
MTIRMLSFKECFIGLLCEQYMDARANAVYPKVIIRKFKKKKK